jgi:hypothetical protein
VPINAQRAQFIAGHVKRPVRRAATLIILELA